MNSFQKILLTLVNFQEKKLFYKIFTTNNLYTNHIYIYIYYNIFFILHLNKLQLHNLHNSLIDLIGVDAVGLKTYNYITYVLTTSFKQIFDFILIYNILDYNTSYRYIWTNLIYKKSKIQTLTSLYANTDWLERELIEFFGFFILNKLDTRNLLLDYNFIWNPLLKNFPVEGFQEIYYNFHNHTLDYISSEFIEL